MIFDGIDDVAGHAEELDRRRTHGVGVFDRVIELQRVRLSLGGGEVAAFDELAAHRPHLVHDPALSFAHRELLVVFDLRPASADLAEVSIDRGDLVRGRGSRMGLVLSHQQVVFLERQVVELLFDRFTAVGRIPHRIVEAGLARRVQFCLAAVDRGDVRLASAGALRAPTDRVSGGRCANVHRRVRVRP